LTHAFDAARQLDCIAAHFCPEAIKQAHPGVMTIVRSPPSLQLGQAALS
jgi:hypothetical protein